MPLPIECLDWFAHACPPCGATDSGGAFAPPRRPDGLSHHQAAPRVQKLVDGLDAAVAGLAAAKRGLAVAVCDHGRRRALRGPGDCGALPGMSHVLLAGPSGSGKTHLVHTLSGLLDVPFLSVDAADLVPCPRRGADLSVIGRRLLDQCAGDREAASRGVVFMDGLERLVADPDDRAAPGRVLQEALLDLLDGHPLRVPVPGAVLELPMRDILFIAAGVPAGRLLGGIAGSHLPADPSVNPFPGLMPELLARFSTQLRLPAPDAAQLTAVLRHPRGPLASCRRLFAFEKVDLAVTAAAVAVLVRACRRKGDGTASLQRLLETALRPALFALPAFPGLRRIWLDAAGEELFVSLAEPLTHAG